MATQCNAEQLEFHGLGRRAVVGRFDGGRISSDAGAVLLRETERRSAIVKRLSECFVDHRDGRRIEHSVGSLVGQRIYGLALGYEDLNDHDALRHDALFGLLSEKGDPTGADRRQARDKGKAVAGKSTLNRLELTPEEADGSARYKKIVADYAAMDALLIDVFIESYKRVPKRIVLDVDATDDPLHGEQEGRFFHGYYRHYCYLPLYIFCGGHLLCARLRSADQDGAAGTQDELSRIVGRLREVWPKTQIIVRGDSGFCRDELLSWCEQQPHVDYVIGVAKNARLKRIIDDAMAQAKQQHELSGEAARVFEDFRYRTHKSWSRERRVVGKAEYLAKGENPRFIVTSLSADDFATRALYEDLYCARGDMENRIKEQQLGLFADRTSSHEMRANQLRLYFSSFAYVLMHALRRLGLAHSDLANAQCDTIRLKLLKVGALIRLSVRKVWIAFSDSYPNAELFRRVWWNLRSIPLRC